MTGKQTLDWRLFAVMYCLIIAAFVARAVRRMLLVLHDARHRRPRRGGAS